MISGRTAHNTLGARLRRKLCERIGRTANLEGSSRLNRFQLQENVGANDVRQMLGSDERCCDCQAGDMSASFEYVRDVQHGQLLNVHNTSLSATGTRRRALILADLMRKVARCPEEMYTTQQAGLEVRCRLSFPGSAQCHQSYHVGDFSERLRSSQQSCL